MKPPSCRGQERWTHFYKITMIYICFMLTIVVALLIKGVA